MEEQEKYFKKYQVYLDERKSLSEAIKETAHQFDKAILTLAAGALALSLTFLTDIAPAPKNDTLWLLFFSWAIFIVSILSTLISFFTSRSACLRQIEIMEYDFVDTKEKSNNAFPEKNPYNKYTQMLNIASIICFILGTILLVVFVSLNFPRAKEDSMSETKTTVQSPTPGSGYIPPAQPIKPTPPKKGK